MHTTWSRICLPFRRSWVHPGFLWGSCYSIFSFMCTCCRSLFVLLYFFFWPSCCLLLLFTDSDYPFGIFKLFLTSFNIIISVVLYSILSVLGYCFIDSRFRIMCFWYKYFYKPVDTILKCSIWPRRFHLCVSNERRIKDPVKWFFTQL